MRAIWLHRSTSDQANGSLGLGLWYTNDEEGKKVYIYLGPGCIVFWWSPAPDTGKE